MADVTAERTLIERFCSVLSQMDEVEVRVAGWPEDSGKGGYDADVDRGGTPTALEMTILNHVENERHHSAIWRQVGDGLEEALNEAFPDRGGWVGLPFDLPKLDKVQRATLHGQLRQDVLDAVASVEEDVGHQVRVEGKWSGFTITVNSYRHGRDFFVAFRAPADHLEQLAADVERALKAKTLSLAAAKKAGTATLLLLHGDNPWIAADGDFLDAFRVAVGRGAAEAFDDVFLVRTSSLFRVMPLQLRGAVVTRGEMDRWNLQQTFRP